MHVKKLDWKGLNYLETDGWGKAVNCLTEAFIEDPCMKYLLRDLANDPKKARYIHEYTLRFGQLYGHVLTTSNNVEGVGIWLPPKCQQVSAIMSSWKFIRAGGYMLNKQISQGTIEVIQQFDAFSQELHHRVISKPHWYLMSIGVAKLYQGKGFARKLIEPMIDYFDKMSQACYLETHNPKNVSLYEKFGFKVMETGLLPDSEITHVGLLREPT